MKYLSLSFLIILFKLPVLSQDIITSNLPIIVINTNGLAIQDEPKIQGDMGIIDNGTGHSNTSTDPFNNYNGKIGIEFRGSSSQMFPKKPYGIELHDAAGTTISASLLGMPEGDDWVLNAIFDDRSLVRDALTLKLGGEFGRYSPRTRFCELILNGEYVGIYYLGEKIKRDKNRVDISKLKDTDISGDNVTGGYIIKIDKTTGSDNEGFISTYPPLNRTKNSFITFLYDYPDFDKITNEQKNYIQNAVKTFEDALHGSDFQNPVNGYAKYIDRDSFVDFLIINELTKNVDGYRLSTYLFKDKDSKGGKLTMGPIWDYNLGYGNADYCDGGAYTGWAYNYNQVCSDDAFLVPFWWNRLLLDSTFRHKLGQRWASLRKNQLSSSAITTYIDSMSTVFDQGPLLRNSTKWPVWNQYVWPTYDWASQQNYPAAINWLKSWINNRMTWLDKNMPDPNIVTSIGESSDPPDDPTTEVENGLPVVKVHAYPNPFSDQIQFEYEITKGGTIQIDIFDVMGSALASISQRQEKEGIYTITLDQHLPSGIYYFTPLFEKKKMPAQRLIHR